MPTSELSELIAAVREARDSKHPSLDLDFLEEVVRIEEAQADDPGAALRLIGQALEGALARSAD